MQDAEKPFYSHNVSAEHISSPATNHIIDDVLR